MASIKLYNAYKIENGKRILISENIFITKNGEMYYRRYNTYCKYIYRYNSNSSTKSGNSRPKVYINDIPVPVEEAMFATFFNASEKAINRYCDGTLRIIYLDGDRSNLNISNLKPCGFIEYAQWANTNDIPVTNISNNAYKQIYNIMKKEGLGIIDMACKYNISEYLPKNASRLYRVQI